MTTIALGDLYRGVAEALDAAGYADVKYSVDVEWWNYRRPDGERPRLSVWIGWPGPTGETYHGNTVDEALNAIRAGITWRATDVAVTL